MFPLVPSMSSPGACASTPADASTLGTLTVTALNVGMMAENSHKSMQGALRARLGRIIMKWLDVPGAAAVALNEIHPNIAAKVHRDLSDRNLNMDIQMATSLSNSLLWCVPQ